MNVRLVTGVPEQHVSRAVEDPVQGNGQLDDTEVGTQVATGARDVRNKEVTDLGGQRLQLIGIKRLNVRGCHDLGEQRHAKRPSLPSHRVGWPRWPTRHSV